ncbi:MAG: hypothetical protein IT477_10315 [Rhodanobacteraceae bacterium]|nr:hypothetical protein [Rhodanobacteraceae bacterium]
MAAKKPDPPKQTECRKSPPARYKKTGATRREHYAWPECYRYPIHTPVYVRAAASKIARFADRLPKNVRKQVIDRIDRAKRKFKIGPYNPKYAKRYKKNPVEDNDSIRVHLRDDYDWHFVIAVDEMSLLPAGTNDAPDNTFFSGTSGGHTMPMRVSFDPWNEDRLDYADYDVGANYLTGDPDPEQEEDPSNLLYLNPGDYGDEGTCLPCASSPYIMTARNEQLELSSGWSQFFPRGGSIHLSESDLADGGVEHVVQMQVEPGGPLRTPPALEALLANPAGLTREQVRAALPLSNDAVLRLAAHPRTPPWLLQALLSTRWQPVYQRLAMNPNTPAAALAAVSHYAPAAVVLNPALSLHVLESQGLLEHLHDSTRQALEVRDQMAYQAAE